MIALKYESDNEDHSNILNTVRNKLVPYFPKQISSFFNIALKVQVKENILES